MVFNMYNHKVRVNADKIVVSMTIPAETVPLYPIDFAMTNEDTVVGEPDIISMAISFSWV